MDLTPTVDARKSVTQQTTIACHAPDEIIGTIETLPYDVVLAIGTGDLPMLCRGSGVIGVHCLLCPFVMVSVRGW